MSDRQRYASATWPTLGKFRLRFGDGPIRTSGYLRNCEIGFVYVGVGARGRVKVGMSATPEARCQKLGVRLHYAHPVVPAVAKLVEQRALALLGHRTRDGEWTWLHSPDQASDAVRKACVEIARFRRVCPYMTEDEARAQRISLASAAEAA